MERISYNSINFFMFLDKLNPNNSGIFFSILLHLVILIFAVGIPNFFSSKEIFVPNIIPIEILNVNDSTNFETSLNEKITKTKIIPKVNKFNSSENNEIIKEFVIDENINTNIDSDTPIIEIKEKNNTPVIEKKSIKVQEKKIIQPQTKVETIKTNKIKPKLKPNKKIESSEQNISDLQIQPKINKKNDIEKKNDITKPKQKPKEDFNIASMLKDLRNEKINKIAEEEKVDEDKKQEGDENLNQTNVLSISEIDLLRQQLSSCWNAPAGAVINLGDKVTISAKIQENMRVFENSIRIIDTNISKSNPFYGPITDSAMRTLLNPECTPLKLPKDKYNLWKNLTITFDYSIMKGY